MFLRSGWGREWKSEDFEGWFAYIFLGEFRETKNGGSYDLGYFCLDSWEELWLRLSCAILLVFIASNRKKIDSVWIPFSLDL